MAAVNPAIIDALNQLQTDSDALAEARLDESLKIQAEAEAVHARQTATNTVNADVDALVGDKAALVALIDSSFPTAPPAPAPGPDQPVVVAGARN